MMFCHHWLMESEDSANILNGVRSEKGTAIVISVHLEYTDRYKR